MSWSRCVSTRASRPDLPARRRTSRPVRWSTYRYGYFAAPLRVVRDDERGLVAWLPEGSEQLAATRATVVACGTARSRTGRELFVRRDVDLVVTRWRGPGILRIVPTGVPWSIWYFFTDDGAFDGHYVNLELPHLRAADGGARTYTRDLTLDLWLDVDGTLWLKDEDELDAAVAGGAYSAEQGAAVREVARAGPARARRTPRLAARRGLGDLASAASLGRAARLAAWDDGGVSVPNVLATRYAGADLAAIWSPEHKIVLERRLWIAVLRAQRDLGVAVPDGVVEDYEAVVEKVDLDSIAARERVTRHDVKARIEEFSALAGHEHVHKGMTSRDLTENVEQLQVRASLELVRDRAVATLARLARLAAEHERP